MKRFARPAFILVLVIWQLTFSSSKPVLAAGFITHGPVVGAVTGISAKIFVRTSEAANVVKIGDTEVDIAEGRNTGCGLVVAVTTGAYTRTELEQYHPDYIIDSLQELPGILNLPA